MFNGLKDKRMRTTQSITFYCRRSKANKNGLAPIECGVDVNGKRVFFNLPSKADPREFNRKRRPDWMEDLLGEWRQRANIGITEILKMGHPLTAETLRTMMQTGGVSSMTLERLWDNYMEIVRKRDITVGVVKKYGKAKELSLNIIGNREVRTILPTDMENFYSELKRMYKESTSAGMMQRMRTLFAYALRNGYVSMDPTNGIKIKKGKPKTEYLTESELETMARADLSDAPRLERARDILIFQCYGGGMSYIDMCHIKVENLKSVDGLMTYTAKREKTGVEFTTILLPKAIEILEKYDYHLPFVSNQKLNAYAKDVAVRCGISKTITTHMMRKSYASLLLQHHIPISTVSKCLGHTTTQQTLSAYAFLREETIVSEFKTLF